MKLPSVEHRSLAKERLDTGEYTDEEYALWLKEARRINRWLGDASALRKSLRHVNGPDISILDVGAGSGELLKIAKEALSGQTGMLVGAELNPKAAREIRSRRFGVHALQCNALSLPFGDGSFDVVMCSLLLHHLDDDESVALLNEMGRVARQLVVVIDLDRGLLSFVAYRTFAPLFLQPLTVEDGALSILRSRRLDELQQIAARTDLRNVVVQKRFPARTLLLAKPPEF